MGLMFKHEYFWICSKFDLSPGSYTYLEKKLKFLCDGY